MREIYFAFQKTTLFTVYLYFSKTSNNYLLYSKHLGEPFPLDYKLDATGESLTEHEIGRERERERDRDMEKAATVD